jgi:hypothetical protein
MTGLDELIARLEKATGPDARLDTDIMIALGQWTEREWWSFDYQKHTPANLTSSLDAAIDLMEKVLPDAQVLIGFKQTEETLPWARSICRHAPDATGRTPAIALCIAILKALQVSP